MTYEEIINKIEKTVQKDKQYYCFISKKDWEIVCFNPFPWGKYPIEFINADMCGPIVLVEK